METWGKVTTRSRISIYRTNDPMETIVGLKLDQDDRHTHIWKKKTLCPVTVLVDSQVSDRCPWATCSISTNRRQICMLIKHTLCTSSNIYYFIKELIEHSSKG